ncbi:DNA repair protein rad2 [Elasticomyces elasticus]|nr:DNA repair protein rad2 [Elasticomyces elasticus]
MQQRTEEAEGGFEKTGAKEAEKKKSEPLPPWFNGDLEEGIRNQEKLERADREKAKAFRKQFQFQGRDEVLLRRQETGEVIDLDAEDEPVTKKFASPAQSREIVEIDDDEEDGGVMVAPELTGVPVDDEIRMGDMADVVRAEPPVSEMASHRDGAAKVPSQTTKRPALFEEVESDEEETEQPDVMTSKPQDERPKSPVPASSRPVLFELDESDDEVSNEPEKTMPVEAPASNKPGNVASQAQLEEDDDEQLDWSESDDGKAAAPAEAPVRADAQPAGGNRVPSRPLALPDGLSRRWAALQDSLTMRVKILAQFRLLDSLTRHAALDDDDFDDFSDPEEEELLRALTLEAEEHARFASTLNQKSAAQNIEEYEKELKQLRNQQKKDRRDADEVTHVMVTECQQLLRLFGLPYVTAPMEAEAQCAELVRLNLVDGIVTDDSDCFLFGGTRVYKNMFNQAKFVECYLASDLEKEFDLTRDKLIAVANLLGSDYTEGLPSVGPVTALEILGEFDGSLAKFRDWWSAVQMNQITKEDDKGNPFRKKFRKNATKLFLPPSFPDPRIAKAYREPEVDSDPLPFQWGVPDLDALRSFLMSTIGWTQERTDEVLVPVIKDMNRRADEGTQANITAFFDGGVGIGAAGATARGEAFAPRKRVEGSKRLGNALGRMAERAKVQRTLSQPDGEPQQRVDMRDVEEGTGQDEPADSDVVATKKPGKRKAKRAASTVDNGESDDDDSELEKPTKKSRKKAAGGRGGRAARKKATVDA